LNNSAPLDASAEGYQYQGNDYFARLLDQTIDTVQAMSEMLRRRTAEAS
jgi:hypothetical protein